MNIPPIPEVRIASTCTFIEERIIIMDLKSKNRLYFN